MKGLSVMRLCACVRVAGCSAYHDAVMKQRGEEEKDASAMEVEGEEPRPKPELMIFGKPLRRQMVGDLCPAQHHPALCFTGLGAHAVIHITSWLVVFASGVPAGGPGGQGAAAARDGPAAQADMHDAGRLVQGGGPQ